MSNIRYAPFIHSSGTASYMNASMLIALLPCAAYAVFRYGLRALILILLSGILACGVKYIFDLLRKKSKQPDINPIVPAVIFALMLPPDTSLTIVSVGIVFMIAIVYEMFGGNNCNVVNGAAITRLFVEVIWPSHLSGFTSRENAWLDLSTLFDWVSKPESVMPAASEYHLTELLAGGYPGFIGTGSIVMVFLGAIYILRSKSTKFYAPAGYMITVMAARLIIHFNDGLREFAVFMLVSSVLFVAVFFMTDRSTVPQTEMGGFITGTACGILTAALFEITSGVYALLVPVVAVNMVSGIVGYLTSYSAERHEPRKAVEEEA